MGKSIRSKREKRLRTLKREIVVPHYDAKELAKLAVQEAALAAPKIELPQKRKEMAEDAIPTRRSTAIHATVESMAIEASGTVKSSTTNSKLKATKIIGKRGKSVKRDLSRKRKMNTKF